MASIYRPQGSKKYRIAYINERGQRVTTGGFRDKTATQEKARRLERDSERARAGLPVADQQRRQQKIDELTELWIAELRRLGRSEPHVKELHRMLKKLWEVCKWECLAQIRVDGLNEYLASLQKQGRGARTLNAYRDALHSFLNYCKQLRWIEENPVAGHPKARELGGKKRKPRRAYSVEEFQRLLEGTLHHRDLYTVAGLSGLRRSELRRLEKRDLTPTGERPVWHLRAEITKGKRRDVVPILPDVLPLVLRLWEQLPKPTSRMFPRIPRTETLHKDLQRARIERVNAEGRCVDFHSLRYFFCTQCARHLPIQIVRSLMRHQDIRQTCNLYMDLGLSDMNERVQELPSILPPVEGS